MGEGQALTQQLPQHSAHLLSQVNLAQRMGTRAVAIIMDAPVDVCLQRVGARRGHEGGIEGTGQFATGVVTRMNSDLKPVTRAEGFSDVCVFSHNQPPHLIAADILLRFGLPLQPNWVPLREKTSGRLYYGNALTKETKWERPSVAPIPRPSSFARAVEAPTQKLWVGNLHPLADKRYVRAQPPQRAPHARLQLAPQPISIIWSRD